MLANVRPSVADALLVVVAVFAFGLGAVLGGMATALVGMGDDEQLVECDDPAVLRGTR